jgi:hypothetical protein
MIENKFLGKAQRMQNAQKVRCIEGGLRGNPKHRKKDEVGLSKEAEWEWECECEVQQVVQIKSAN